MAALFEADVSCAEDDEALRAILNLLAVEVTVDEAGLAAMLAQVFPSM